MPDNGPRNSPTVWYRLPIVWLGALLFLAALAGSVAMIVLGSKYPDEPVPTPDGELFKVPRGRVDMNVDVETPVEPEVEPL